MACLRGTAAQAIRTPGVLRRAGPGPGAQLGPKILRSKSLGFYYFA